MLYLTIHYPAILNDAVPWMSGSLSLDKEQLKIEMVDSFDLGIEPETTFFRKGEEGKESYRQIPQEEYKKMAFVRIIADRPQTRRLHRVMRRPNNTRNLLSSTVTPNENASRGSERGRWYQLVLVLQVIIRYR